ncbi:hypothetical protein K505DRAFT_348882 [Melanomma pulvis-pyrius CBS 109.77]|uniref:C2H2-type domain-containing protein n=1 Tax=Melanomma pulvis-pyrius CBS 109.77 TaxID=1314802 RepID=A0A6A6XGL7_9PLEO|nr:hypothetical protein K505DRAFT_348882 [Melanomma pulvis-pyrius CBS 109.77]
MATRGVNRFAIFEEDDNSSSSASDPPTPEKHASNDRVLNSNENWCGVCQMKFSSKTALLSHVKQLPSHQNYCNLCKRVFKHRNGLLNHINGAVGHDIFCNLCLSAFKDKWGLRNHLENNYSVGHEFACLTCLMAFKSRNEMELHLRTAPKHVRCDTCHRNFRNQNERDDHWINTTKHKHCLQPGCDFDAPNLNVLDKHLKNDHFQCEGCRMIFPSHTKLTAHAAGCVFGIPCDTCGNMFHGQASLAAHQESCFKCAECNFNTTHPGNYQIHMTKHTLPTLKCWTCDVPMRTQSSLINHLESGRCPKFEDPTILTQTLGKWWYSPLYMDLDIHAQIRTSRIDMQVIQKWISEGSIHPFICRAPDCKKTFARFSSLVLHVESQACKWEVPRLGLDKLKREITRDMT